MKKLCHAFCKVNNVFSLIISILGIVLVAGLIIALVIVSNVEFEEDVAKAAAIGGIAGGLFSSCVFVAIGLIGYFVGKKVLYGLDTGASKKQLFGYAICLIVFGGFAAAGVVIIATPSRYFGNIQ